MAILLVKTITVSPVGFNANVHTKGDEDRNDDFEGAAHWGRMTSITLFPGCSAFCPRACVCAVLSEPIRFSFVA